MKSNILIGSRNPLKDRNKNKEMKQSSTEQPKKKLIQARLPFQILSPGEKTPTIPPGTRKRKASNENETPCKIIDANEDQVAPAEKKPKVVNSSANNDIQTKDVKPIETKEETVKTSVTKEDKAESKHQTVAEKARDLDYKDSSQSNTSPKTKNSQSINTSIKSNNANSNKESASLEEIVINVCDSPCKTDKKPSQPEHDKNERSDEAGHNVSEEINRKRKRDEVVHDDIKRQPDANILSIENAEDKSTPKTTEKDIENTEKEVAENNINSTRSSKVNDFSSPKPPNKLSESQAPTSELRKLGHEKDANVDLSCNPTSFNEEPNSGLCESKTPKTSQTFLDDLLSITPSVDDSINSVDISLSSECNTSTETVGTQKNIKRQLSNTPRRLTSKQQLRLKEKENRLKEKELLKQEKAKKKADEREEKLRLKQEKEEEKRKEKEEKERKKQAEIDQKNEEKRLKEEEKRAKEEEKRKKEEEENKKKEEKRLKEEQKLAEKRRSAQVFASFFLKSESKLLSGDDIVDSTPQESKFQPFEVKIDMRLAPLVRSEFTRDRRHTLDSFFGSTQNKSLHTYLEELRRPMYVKGSAGKTWPPPDDSENDVMIIESENPNEETESRESDKKTERKKQRAKLLQFQENRRPPYWGTWRKKSKFIRPRAPLNEDKTMFEYDVDSDDEWEEPEDGESLRGSEDEESQDEQYEEDNDMFVPHGYLSDEEGQDDLDDKSPEAVKAKLKFLQLEFEAERKEKQEKLKPRLIGCVWFCNTNADPSLAGSYIADLFLSRRAVWEGTLPLKLTSPVPTSTSTPPDMLDNEETRGAKRKLVPESMMPSIIRRVHGSRRKLTRLLAEVLDSCEPEQRPSKRCLADRIRQVASWTRCEEIGFHCWYVTEEFRQAHNLMDLKISPPTKPRLPTTPIANITKFTKVLTPDERLKLLSDQKESQKPFISSVNVLAPSTSTLTTPVKNPAAKKKVPFTTIGPVQSGNTIRNFTVTNKPSSPFEPLKRITPITLASTVSKPPTAVTEESVVLSD